MSDSFSDFNNASLVQDAHDAHSDCPRRKRKLPSRYRDKEWEEQETKFSIPRSQGTVVLTPAVVKLQRVESPHSLSESYLEHNGPKVEADEETHSSALILRLCKSVESMQQELKVMNERQLDLSNQLCEIKVLLGKDTHISSSDPLLPDDLQLPITKDEDLIHFNARLHSNENLKANLIRYFHRSAFGKTLSSYVLSVTRTLLTREVALLYSRLGRKGKKSFEGLKEMFNVILEGFQRLYMDAFWWFGIHPLHTAKSENGTLN